MTKSRKTKTTGSVITPEFRDRYAADGSTGDALAKRLKRHVTADDGSADLVENAGQSQQHLERALGLLEFGDGSHERGKSTASVGASRRQDCVGVMPRCQQAY
jgi:hypothetical protein